MKKKGFTLIELLVVIAIIGILAGIVLVSLGGARTKAKDAAIKANMDSMRLACELKYTDDPITGYTNCSARADYTAAKAAAVAVGAVFTEGINTAGTAYCIQSTLPGGGSWCLDSVGSTGSTAVACDVTGLTPTFDCATD